MDSSLLKQHKFQLISFCDIFHHKKTEGSQINEDSHLIHVIKGCAEIEIDNSTYEINEGCVIAVPPFVSFRMHIPGNFRMINMHYKIWLNDGQLLSNLKKLPVIFRPPYFKWCKNKLEFVSNIIKREEKQTLPDPFVHEIVLNHMLNTEMEDVRSGHIDSRIQKACEKLESPDCTKFNAKEISSICCLSKSQMNRKFQIAFGLSPQKYWEKQRLKHICMELKYNDKPIYEVAEKFGFTDQGYFSRWFKSRTNCAPSSYRTKESYI